MPEYDYECPVCKERATFTMSIIDYEAAHPRTCKCGHEMKRKWTAPMKTVIGVSKGNYNSNDGR